MSALEQPIPKGYKQTEVGMIPSDWFVKAFGQVMSIRHGKDQKAIQVPDGCYPIYGTGGQMGTTNTALYDKPSVLIGRKGTINKPRYIDKPFWTVDTLFYSEVSNSESAKFIYYKFCMIDWMQYNEASGVPSLNASTIESVTASFPELKEQTVIANALSDVDALLTELDKLIAKKQAIKTATMQQLLTGKTRLPQFATYTEGEKQGQPKGTKPSELGEIPEDWDVLPAREAIEFFGGYGFSSRLSSDNGVKWLKIANVGLNEVKWDANSFLPEKLLTNFKAYSLEENDVVMALTRPLLSDKLKIAKITSSDLPALLNQRVAKLIPKRSNCLEYIFYVVQRAEFIAQMNLAMAGTDPPNIGTTALGNINIAMPQAEEQTTIATILSDMDNEIQNLEQRLAKTRQIKQGMMQELLIGRTRLPISKEAV